MSDTPIDSATVAVATSSTVAPADEAQPHVTGELPAPTPGPVDTTAGAADPEKPEGQEPPKTRDRAAERRISKLTAKYEEAQREIGRLQGIAEARGASQPAVETASVKPQQSQFATVEEYVEALTDWTIGQREGARDRETAARSRHEAIVKAHDEAARTVVEKLTEAGKDIDGFDEVLETITAPDFPSKEARLTAAMRDFLGESDHSALLAQWMVENPKEAARIAKLTDAVAVKALEREEKRLAAKPPVRPTSAPPPPPTLSGRSTATVDMAKVTDMDEWAKLRGFS